MKITNPAIALFLAAGLLGGCASNQPKEEAKPETAAAAETKPAEAAPAPSAKSNDTYSVVRGDNLWNISGKPVIYGNPYEWPLIFKANRDKIRDADLIEPGQVFAIDRNASASDVDAAVAHAKTRGSWQVGVTEQSDLAYLSKYGMK
jgi:nucleoid-associated protein YgaU